MLRINTGILGVLASCVLMASGAYASGIDTSHPSTAPRISFKDEKDNVRNINPENTKLTLVHFWATWCVPCVEELAEVDATQWAYDKQIKVIAISLDGDDANAMEKVKDFMREHKLVHLPPYLDNHMTSYNMAGIKGLPTTLFIDKQGKEIGRADGPLNWNSREVTDFIDKQVK